MDAARHRARLQRPSRCGSHSRTLVAAAPLVTLLVWILVAAAVAGHTDILSFSTSPIGIAATIGYGLLLGVGVPLRREVTRYPAPDSGGSPST